MPVVAVSLKMYFPPERTRAYAADLAHALAAEPLPDGVTLAVLPDFLTLAGTATTLAASGVRIGAQDLAPEDRGALTGEVSGADLAALGASIAEIGHAERRREFGEDEDLIARKVAAAVRNGLTPLLCVGEARRPSSAEAAAHCLSEIDAATRDIPGSQPLWVAYEPIWAIGAEQAAPEQHIRTVCTEIRGHLAERPGSATLYGGSAGPGLIARLHPAADGVFLGRRAHEVPALLSVVREAASLHD